MKKIVFVTTFILTIIINVYGQTPVDYVNTLMGSASKASLSTGNTYPAIARPWGMNFWTPQTGRMGNGWIYTYDADKIRGFKQTHQPSPWINDYGQFAVMPVVDIKHFDEEHRASWFSHKAEVATPYYYKVYLADYDVTTEIAPTSRAAAFRISYPKSNKAYFVVDAFDKGSYVKILPERRMILGYSTKNSGGVPTNFKNYFVLQFDRPFEYTSVQHDSMLVEGKLELAADHAMAIVGFKLDSRDKVNVKVASSFISYSQAIQNLNEIKSKSFDEVKKEGKVEWNDVLGRISIKDNNTDHLRTFYTCLYRSTLFPRSLYEIDKNGNPVHYSPYNGKVLTGYMFTDTGFWDTFRSLFPLLNLVYPSMSVKMQKGLVNAYKESGFLPEWASPGHRDCMVGNNSVSIVADAYLKGLRGYDIETLWKAVVHGANAEHPTITSSGRKGFACYNKFGYVPYDVGIKESVARTLEYSYDDWCIYQLGLALGKSGKELAAFKKHSMNYQNVFYRGTNLMRGRNEDGTFQKPFNPFKWGDAFTEGNSWHYTWSVFHDPAGLAKLMGGERNMAQMLDSVFILPPIFDDSYYGFTIHEIREMQIMNMGNYAHGNQPIQHMIYLYDYVGQPWKTQYWVKEVMDRLYLPTPDGYCGDEDNGQTSAWYVFSALGFYPVCPGSNEYALGIPYFDKIRIKLENGKIISIKANNLNSSNRYIKRLSVNGMPYTKNYLNHKCLVKGATLIFDMTQQPNKKRGILASDAPYSFSRMK